MCLFINYYIYNNKYRNFQINTINDSNNLNYLINIRIDIKGMSDLD